MRKNLVYVETVVIVLLLLLLVGTLIYFTFSAEIINVNWFIPILSLIFSVIAVIHENFISSCITKLSKLNMTN